MASSPFRVRVATGAALESVLALSPLLSLLLSFALAFKVGQFALKEIHILEVSTRCITKRCPSSRCILPCALCHAPRLLSTWFRASLCSNATRRFSLSALSSEVRLVIESQWMPCHLVLKVSRKLVLLFTVQVLVLNLAPSELAHRRPMKRSSFPKSLEIQEFLLIRSWRGLAWPYHYRF